MKQLILGGMKSGKSRLAESLTTDIAREQNKKVIYIATSTRNDEEMSERVKKHRAMRPSHWQTIEEPINLAKTLKLNDDKNTCLLIDCLTLWITNLLMTENNEVINTEINALLTTLPTLSSDIIFVSNETGLGIIPMGDLTRKFCDQTGLLHQEIAKLCDRVIFTVAGLPHVLKGKEI